MHYDEIIRQVWKSAAGFGFIESTRQTVSVSQQNRERILKTFGKSDKAPTSCLVVLGTLPLISKPMRRPATSCVKRFVRSSRVSVNATRTCDVEPYVAWELIISNIMPWLA